MYFFDQALAKSGNQNILREAFSRILQRKENAFKIEEMKIL